MKDALVAENAACVTDGKIITGTSAGTAVPFALALIEALKGAEAAGAIADQIVIR
jgi:putative intracellular protease/amidase